MQQPLERYGVVVLLFLVALVAVAIFWEDGTPKIGPEQPLDEPLVQLDPVKERPRTPEPSTRALDESANRTERLALSREADPELVGRDQRTRTNSYGVTPRVQVSPESSEPRSAADSRGDNLSSQPLPRGGNVASNNFVGDNGRNEIADVYDSNRGGRDPMGADLARAGDRNSERSIDSSFTGRGSVAPSVGLAPKAQPASSPVLPPRTVVVRDGDSLWRIAERELGNGNRWTELAEANGLREQDALKVGIELRMPGTSAKASVATPVKGNAVEASAPRNGGVAPTNTSVGPNGARPYIVRSGDSLNLIAQRELGSVRHAAAIQALNNMKSDVVMLDTRLWLPASGTIPASAPALAPSRPRTTTPRAEEALAAAPKRAPRGDHFVR